MASRQVIVRFTCAAVGASLASALAVGACKTLGYADDRTANRAPSIALRGGFPDAGEAAAPAPPWEAGLPRMEAVLDDPRLAAARRSDADGDPAAAAREIDRLRSTASLDAGRACSWSYLAGRLHLEAGETNEAAAAFEAAAGPECPLGGYAHLRQGEALVRSGRADQALAALGAVGDDVALRDEVELATADAFVAKGDRAAAVRIWRSELARAPHGLRWVDSSMQLARALLDGVDGPPASGAREAFDRVTRVVVEAPAVAEKLDASAVRDRAAVAMGRRGAPKLTFEERARQARGWLDASRSRRAREVADDVLREIPRGDRGRLDVGCRAATVRAQATPRGRAEDAAEAWGVAIDRCRGVPDGDGRAVALYQGGKASASAKRFSEALARFGDVEHEFPTHRLADDARFRAALVLDEEGDRARSLAMLASIADAYPGGDMGRDALFRVALAKLEARELPEAAAILDRLLASPPEAWSWGAAARAEYFRARVAELDGDRGDAESRYAAIVAHRPLSYFMLLAFSRLKSLDDALALSTVERAIRDEPGGAFLTARHPEFESASFRRFVRLLEVGEVDAARREVAAGGLTSETADSEVLWTIGWLFERAGAPEIGHAFSRARLTDYRSHWPAGRWRFAWEVAFPRPWSGLVRRESDASRIPAPLTWAIMREESAFDPEARSPANALGLMQLMGPTAQKVAKGTPIGSDEQALRRPEVSIALGARLLSSLRTSFPDRPELAIAAYNGGATAVRRWLEDRGGDSVDVFVERIPYDETRNYVKRVLASQAAYAYLYAPASLDELTAMATAGPVAPRPAESTGVPVAEGGVASAPPGPPESPALRDADGGVGAPGPATGRDSASTPAAVAR